MKKQVFSLMLSTAIFTTSPLFAMEPPENPRAKHLRLVQNPETAEGQAGRGSFSPVEDLITQDIIEKIEDEKAVVNVSCTSHAMNFLCQTPIYKAYAKNHFLPLGSLVELQGHVHSFFNLFSDSQQTYKVSIAQIELFKKKPYVDPHHTCTWFFSLGNKRLQMVNNQVGPDHLEDLDRDAMVTFSWSPARDNLDVGKFWASVPVVIGQAVGVKDLQDEAYSRKVSEGIIGGPNNYQTISNSFTIIPIKLLPQ